METAEEHVYSAWQEQKAQEEKMREKRSIGIDLHRRRFTCCVRLEKGRNYLSEWSLEQLPQFIKKSDRQMNDFDTLNWPTLII